MSQPQQNPYFSELEEQINLRELLTKYTRQWPWFLLAFFVALTLAFLYLRYSTPIYQTTATIIIQDENQKGGQADLSAFAEMGLLGGMGTNSIENEIGLLKSRRLLTTISKDLQLHVRYFKKGNIQSGEMYTNRPFNVQVLDIDESKLRGIEPFEIRLLNAKQAEVINVSLSVQEVVDFGKPVELPIGTLLLTPNDDLSALNLADIYLVSIGTIENVVDTYRRKLQVNLADKNSTLIELSLQDAVSLKAEDILNNLVVQYNREAIEDKNQVSLNTARFIDERLAIISSELDSVETGKQEFKIDNRLTNIEAESQLFIENASEFKKEKLELETQLELTNSIIEYLEQDSGGLLPTNLGLRDGTLISTIDAYNKIVLERNRILAGTTELNPVVVNLNQQIQDMRVGVMQSLQNLRTSLQISKRDLAAREAGVNQEIARVPSKEKQFRDILRQQNVKEALYLFLLQKREETNLALAATSPKAKIVDKAYTPKTPVSPKSKIILFAAGILGFLIPFSIIYVRGELDNKIQNKDDLKQLTQENALLGEIPKLQRGQTDLIEPNDRSILAEAFRILHTNLQFLLGTITSGGNGNIIMVTSTIKGEGKTFVAFNLALTMAQENKRILLIGADLRNPQLQRYDKKAKKLRGISDYLSNETANIKDYIVHSNKHPHLDLLPSGKIPLNPAILLRREKTNTMFAELREVYDYILVDTAPLLLVTDTFLISKHADLVLYMVRAGYTEKNLSRFAVDAQEQGKLGKLGYVLNDVKADHFGYGNKYGYYYAYGEERPSFWKKLKANLKR